MLFVKEIKCALLFIHYRNNPKYGDTEFMNQYNTSVNDSAIYLYHKEIKKAQWAQTQLNTLLLPYFGNGQDWVHNSDALCAQLTILLKPYNWCYTTMSQLLFTDLSDPSDLSTFLVNYLQEHRDNATKIANVKTFISKYILQPSLVIKQLILAYLQHTDWIDVKDALYVVQQCNESIDRWWLDSATDFQDHLESDGNTLFVSKDDPKNGYLRADRFQWMHTAFLFVQVGKIIQQQLKISRTGFFEITLADFQQGFDSFLNSQSFPNRPRLVVPLLEAF
jgi:hypothetical protein